MKWRILQIAAWALAALAAFSIFLLLPTAVAYADNCGSLADCFPTTDAATMVTVSVAVLIAVGVLALPHLLENPLPPGDALPPAPPTPAAPELPHMPPLPGAQPSVGSALPHAPQFPGGQVAQHSAGAEMPHAPHFQGGEAAQHRAGPELPREQQVQSGQVAQHPAGAEGQRIHQTHPGEQHHVEPEHHGEHHHAGELEQPPTQPLSHEGAARPAAHHGQIPEHEQAHHSEQHQEETLRREEPHQHEQPHHHHEQPHHHHKPHKHEIEHEHDEPGKHEEATIPLRGPHPSPEVAGHRPEAPHVAGEARDHRVDAPEERGHHVEQGVTPEARGHQVHPAQQEVPHIPEVGPEAPVETLLGLHHITALASDPQRNIDFYSGLLGLRLVKITVNSDAPNTYQLYYGDTWGQPGSVLSFVCKPNAAPGARGTGQVTSVAFAVAEGALQFWAGYLAQRGITVGAPSQRFEAQVLSFFDPDGLQIDLVAQREAEGRGAWPHSLIPPAYVLRGLHSTSVAVAQYEQTGRLLTEVLGFRLEGEAGNRRRYQLPGVATGAALDVVHLPTVPGGSAGVGIVQHVSWRTPNAASQMAWSYKLEQLGMRVSQITDHVYFRSLYFYEPAGVLFDIATDQPGFVVDERVEELGTHLLLPPRFEAQRAQLQQTLQPLRLPTSR